MNGEEVYLDTAEAAAFLRRPVSTLAYWRIHKEGPPYGKIGKRVLYRRSDLVAWLESHWAKDDA